MDEIYAYPENDYRSFLEHHGVPGQKWGVRKAAWYPISAFQKAKATVGSKVAEFRQKRVAEKKRKQRAANLQKAREARAKKVQEQKDFSEEKKRILTSGTPGEVVKIASKLTNEELKEAVARNASLETLRNAEKKRIKEIEDAEYEKKWGKIDKIAKTADKISGYAKTASGLYTNVMGLMNLFKDPESAVKEASKDQEKQAKKEEKQAKKEEKQAKKEEKQAKKEEKKQEKESKKEESYKQTVEDKPADDKNQRAEFKSKIVDGDWSEVVGSDDISTALSVVSKAVNSYDSAKSSRAVSNGMKLLESKNYSQLALPSGDDDDGRRLAVNNRPLLPGPSDSGNSSSPTVSRRSMLTGETRNPTSDVVYRRNLLESAYNQPVNSTRSNSRLTELITTRPEVMDMPVSLNGAKTPDLWIPYENSSKSKR